MAAPVITSFSPAYARRGDTITIIGTDFATSTGVTIGGETATFSVDAETTVITATVPAAVSDGDNTIGVTNPEGTSFFATPLNVISSELSTTFVTSSGGNLSTNFITQDASLSTKFVTSSGAPLVTNFITRTAGLVSKFITKVGGLVSNFITASDSDTYLGQVTIVNDCQTLTITDIFAYGANRSNYSLSMSIQNLRTGKNFTVTPDNSDPLLASEWTITLDRDGIYECVLFDNTGGTIRNKELVLVNCKGDNCQKEIESIIAQNVMAGKSLANRKQYRLIYGLNACIDACFELGEYGKVYDCMDFLDARCNDCR